MTGAAVLCALGAVRSGAGLVRVATTPGLQSIISKRAPLEVTSVGASTWPQIKKVLKSWRPHIIACGPGLGLSAQSRRVVKELLARSDIKLVLDADGLNALAKISKPKIRCEFIMTPHAGELARLLGSTAFQINRDRVSVARNAAMRFKTVCLLKGAGTLVTDGRQVWANPTGNPAMASGGMGDVLTGIIAALWAQNPGEPLQAAVLGAYLHGLAGDIASKHFPERSMLASDVAATLPVTFKNIYGNRRRS